MSFLIFFFVQYSQNSGACEYSYTYNSAMRGCIKCNSDQSIIPAFIGLAVFCLILLLCLTYVMKDSSLFGGGGFRVTQLKYQEHKKWLLSIMPFSILKHVDRGMIKVVWATAQILGTISWNLRIRYPEPFQSLLKVFALLQLDFFAVHTFNFIFHNQFFVLYFICHPSLFFLFNCYLCSFSVITVVLLSLS